MPQTQIKLESQNFLELIKDKNKIFFVFDYDGTLTPIVKDHNAAILKDQETDLINKLNAQSNTKVAIVTGRALQNLKSLLQDRLDPSISLYGTHGAEVGEEADANQYKAQLNEIKNKLKDEQNILFEEKPISLTIHYKTHPNRKSLIDKLNKIAKDYESIFRIQMGHDVYEYLPKDINKGMAIKDLYKKYPDYYLIFLGDDLTDNFGFEVINSIGGMSIQVSERIQERKAGYLIDKVEDTYSLIQSYLEAR